jgi:YVTN family beta-propeller protein
MGTLLASPASPQYLETTIKLPDTLGWLSFPWSVARNTANNKIYVGCDDGILVIDGTTNQRLARIKMTGGRAWALCYNPHNNKVYCADLGLGRVVVIGGATDSVIATREIVAYSLCYNSQSNKVYCVTPDDNTVTVIDGATNAVVATLDVGDWPHGLCYNPQNNKVYCANSGAGSDNVTVIDGASNAVLASVPAGYCGVER